MREIKFRGIAKHDLEGTCKKGDWVYGTVAYEGNQPYIVGAVVEVDPEYILFEFWMPVEAESVGQFTGLHDRNGKEIYEGDVVKSDLSENPGGVVEWCTPNACFVIREDKKTLIPIDIKDGTSHMKVTEVIGNVYQDSHLLDTGV